MFGPAGFSTDSSMGPSIQAEVVRMAEVEARRRWTPTLGPPSPETDISACIEELERVPPVIPRTGDAEPSLRAARPVVTERPERIHDLVARSAQERVALLARKFAGRDLNAEEQARIELATQRVEAAYTRASPEAFEHLARISEHAADGIERAKEVLRQLKEMGQ